MRQKYTSTNPMYDDKEAQFIGVYLERTFPEGLTAQDVVEKARPSRSPIHKYFEWDNKVAAEKYRQRQASNMISCIVLEIDGIPDCQQHTPTILVGEVRKRYPTEKARKTPELWRQYLELALKDANQWAARYKRIQQLSPIRMAISKVGKKVASK